MKVYEIVSGALNRGGDLPKVSHEAVEDREMLFLAREWMNWSSCYEAMYGFLCLQSASTTRSSQVRFSLSHLSSSGLRLEVFVRT